MQRVRQQAALIIDNKYLVETILFDDLIDYIPKNSNGNNYKNVIIKVDIESHEKYAFKFAKNFFSIYNVKFVYMEWQNLATEPVNNEKLVIELIDFYDFK